MYIVVDMHSFFAPCATEIYVYIYVGLLWVVMYKWCCRERKIRLDCYAGYIGMGNLYKFGIYF